MTVTKLGCFPMKTGFFLAETRFFFPLDFALHSVFTCSVRNQRSNLSTQVLHMREKAEESIRLKNVVKVIKIFRSQQHVNALLNRVKAVLAT